MEVKPYYNEDKNSVAVLISLGFGAGWSTWNGEELAYDARVVEFFLKHSNDTQWLHNCSTRGTKENKEANDFFTSLGYEHPYMGGFGSLKLVWIPTGTLFRIQEYDGAESIEFFSKEDWMCF